MNIEQERELFEDCVNLNFPDHSTEIFNELYVHIETEDMWQIWQARAKVSRNTPSKVDYSSNEWPELFAEYNEYEKGYDDGKTDGWNDCIDAMNGE